MSFSFYVLLNRSPNGHITKLLLYFQKLSNASHMNGALVSGYPRRASFAQRFNDTHLTNALKSPFCFPICVSQFRSTGLPLTATFHTTISLLIAVFSFLTPLAFVRFTYPHCVLLEQRFSELFLSIKGNNLTVGNRIQWGEQPKLDITDLQKLRLSSLEL